ncbi:unnamed protein product (macronuclear) [Paramecium tetraurelia]|uniref:Uncharacterized protein n=1 Tax=Paramecium tetraurelia TaxID=5888 RepID=A0E7S8_PARTE|nr:uncharacterized protein GSPATT00024073001 [Paramecium tetraurelia]CAK91345.1 unnamed protein product [Paramecium tetraurelia]
MNQPIGKILQTNDPKEDVKFVNQFNLHEMNDLTD